VRIPLPREHGAWVMLCLSLLAGGILAGGNRVGASLLAATLGVLGFLAQHALREWVAGRVPIRAPLALGGFAGALLLLDSRTAEHWRWIALPLAAGIAAWTLRWYRSRGGRTRMADLPSHLAGVVALSSLSLLVAMPDSRESALAGLRLWMVLSVQFAIGAMVVHARLTGRSAFAKATMLAALVGVAAIYLVDRDARWLSLSLVFAAAALVRSVTLTRRWPLARVGWSEAVTGLAVCILGALR